MITAVDTNVLVDVLEPDPRHGPASLAALKRCRREGALIACEVVWAELATAYCDKEQQLQQALEQIGLRYSALEREAALAAARCWARHRQRSKGRDRIAADFLIGGHALQQADRLLSRDRDFYREAFRPLKVLSPRSPT